MFAVLSQAFEAALAPEVPKIVDFRHHWSHFLRFYAENKPLSHKSQPVERTHLVFHLNQMLKLLIQEQKEVEAHSMGPCMEYVINHQVLDILSSLAQADTPPGLRPYIINLFVFLLTKIKQTILPYVNVYYPMRRLLMLSSIVKASPTENQEMLFITSLVTKIKAQPECLTLFAHESLPGEYSRTSSRRSSAASSVIDLSHIEELALSQKAMFDQFQSRHLLVSALLNFLDSADYLVSIKAMDALLVVCALPDEISALNAVQGTEMLPTLVGRLVRLFEAIPLDLDIGMIEEVRVNWAEAHHFHAQSSSVPDFPGKTELVAFYSWLDFCDSLIKGALDAIADALAADIRSEFLEKVVEAHFMDAREPLEIVQTVAKVTQCWSHIQSRGLAGEFCIWLFGDNTEPELKGVITHPFKHHVLQLCHHESQEVVLETLSLYDVVLERPCDPILKSLVLANLQLRGYYNGSLAEASISSWSDEEDEREKLRPGSGLELSPRSRKSSPMAGGSRTMAPTNIARVINAWLYMVPDELRSSDLAKDSGYEQYVKNAQTQVASTFRSCEGFNWPSEATFPERSDTLSSDSRPEADPSRQFYEGEFLGTLFDMLENLLEQDYEVNLSVTALLAKLAQLPHPYLHEFLLNPTIPIVPGTRTLHSLMQNLLMTIKNETKTIEQLQRKVYVCRKTLLGSESDRIALNLTRRETKVIDGLIILEEFSKEIAAITLVKYHQAC